MAKDKRVVRTDIDYIGDDHNQKRSKRIGGAEEKTFERKYAQGQRGFPNPNREILPTPVLDFGRPSGQRKTRPADPGTE